MYNDHFGLKESPFSIAPDPRYLYMSEQHREALAHLVYGFNSDGGFVLLTGEVGTGKTTVCRCLLGQMNENSNIAFILNPKLSVEELLATICDEFGIPYPDGNTSIKIFVDLINAFLLDAHSRSRKAVLIIDEAQNLSAEVLEQLRLLTNLETNQIKLLHIILLGQPELRDKLSRPELRQLSQRVIARYHLGALSRKEVSAYVAHRLSVAGSREHLFPDSTMNKLYRLSEGIPRLINVLCDRSLLGTYTLGKNEVSRSTLTKAAREVFGESKTGEHRQYRNAAVWIFSIIILVAVGVVLAATYYKGAPGTDESNGMTEPVIPESIQPQSLKWPGNLPLNSSSRTAFTELFDLWGVTYQADKGSSFCDQAKTAGLLCSEELGSILSLRNLNRPAVLKLSDNQGSVFYAALTALKTESAVLAAGGEEREFSLKDIESHWLGEYTLMWRPPPNYKNIIKPGGQDPLVLWLDKKLSALQGITDPPRAVEEFDDKLVNRVKQYQLSKGLRPDGIVGAHTLIHLNTDTGVNAPLLFDKHED